MSPSMASSMMGGGGVVTPQTISIGMGTFFGKPAYKAIWTKDVIRTLKAILDVLESGKVGGGRAGFLSGVGTAVLGSRVAKGVGALVGLGGAALSTILPIAGGAILSAGVAYKSFDLGGRIWEKLAGSKGDKLDRWLTPLVDWYSSKAFKQPRPFGGVGMGGFEETPLEGMEKLEEDWMKQKPPTGVKSEFGGLPEASLLPGMFGGTNYDLLGTQELIEAVGNLVKLLEETKDKTIEKQMLEKLVNIDKVLEKRGIDMIQTPEEAMGVSGRTDEINR